MNWDEWAEVTKEMINGKFTEAREQDRENIRNLRNQVNQLTQRINALECSTPKDKFLYERIDAFDHHITRLDARISSWQHSDFIGGSP